MPSEILQAMYEGRRDDAERLAEGRQLDLFEAAALGQIDVLRDRLADPSAAHAFAEDGFTALHLACFFAPPPAIRLLLDRGADPRAVADNGMRVTPLHSAAARRRLDVVGLLLHHGADVNARQQGGFTALHSAALHGDEPMVRHLLDHGADAAIAAEDGRTAVDMAEEKGHAALANLIRERSRA